jgi:hypothetical protein
MPVRLVVQPPFSPSFKKDNYNLQLLQKRLDLLRGVKSTIKPIEAVVLSRADLRLDQSQKL